MTKTVRKPYGKMNLTLEKDFYQFLRQKAREEHLPVSTYVKKFLMDNLLNDKTEERLENKRTENHPC